MLCQRFEEAKDELLCLEAASHLNRAEIDNSWEVLDEVRSKLVLWEVYRDQRVCIAFDDIKYSFDLKRIFWIWLLEATVIQWEHLQWVWATKMLLQGLVEYLQSIIA